MPERDFITRAQMLSITRRMLARAKRAYLKLHVEEALDDAERVCAESGCRIQPWMRGPLAQRARLRSLKRPAKRPGRRTNFFRDDLWFHMVQDRRDNGMLLKEALADTETCLNWYARTPHSLLLADLMSENEMKRAKRDDQEFCEITYGGLRTAYNRHRKKVKLVRVPGIGRCWIPRRFAYVSGDPALFEAS